MKYFIDKHNCNFNILCWCKLNPVPFGNSNFLSDIEYCLVFYEKGAKFNQGAKHKSKFYISNLNQKDTKDYEHPTIKPYELVERHIINSTQKGDIVFDPFSGSGTTCAVAKALGRQYIGFEIDEHFYKISKDRINGMTIKDRKAKDLGIQTIFDFIEK